MIGINWFAGMTGVVILFGIAIIILGRRLDKLNKK